MAPSLYNQWTVPTFLNHLYMCRSTESNVVSAFLFSCTHFSTFSIFLPAHLANLALSGGLTTSSAITALFFYLSRNPSSYARLTSEIRSKFNEASEIVTSPTLSSCTYLRACINETLRMSPPAPGTLWRELPSNSPETHVVIDGHIVPRGTLVGVNTYTIHHNETYFKDPFEFEPERWLMYEKGSEQDNADFKLQQEAFQPFSLGTRACVGKVMANMEMSLLVARTLWYLDFERAGGTGIDKEGENTLVGEARGRLGGREKEFEIFDQLVTSHNGPLLRFRPTGNK